jgi:sigma-B regulation protein RsbU (phosphoserine phosphatase)
MSPQQSAVSPALDAYPEPEVRNAYVKALRQTVGPLAEAGQASLVYASPTGIQWVVGCAGCPCSQVSGQEVPCLVGEPMNDRQCQDVELWYKNRSAGVLGICCPVDAHPVIETTLREVGTSLLRQLELEKQNETLRADLHAVAVPAPRPSDPASDRLRQDMETAGSIQQTLLLGRSTVDLQNGTGSLTANAMATPSLQVGGDFYDLFAYDQVLDVVIGDVMGKGIPAALLGAATKNHMLRAINYLLASNRGELPKLKAIFDIVSAEVFRELAGIERFVTLVFARFDLARRQVEIIDCGHPRTVHVRDYGTRYDLIQGENMPLGFQSGETYNELIVPLGSGDTLFFSTDGLTEARKAGGNEKLGERALAEMVCGMADLEPREMVEQMTAKVMDYAGMQAPEDDLTCVAVKVEFGGTIASTRDRLEIPSELKQLPHVRAFVRNLCRQHCDLAAIAEDLAQLELAITEVVSNIIRHAYLGQPDGKIRIELNLYVNRVALEVYHRGVAFDPATATPPAPEEAARKGLTIIRQCVDRVDYVRSKFGENCVYLEKWLKH